MVCKDRPNKEIYVFCPQAIILWLILRCIYLRNGLENIQNLTGDQFSSGFQKIAPGPFGLHFLQVGELVDLHKNITYASLWMSRTKNNHFLAEVTCQILYRVRQV
jgi:hypothetical protein